MQRPVSWHDKHTNAGTYTKSLRVDAGREKLFPSYTGALCKYRKMLFHLGSTRSLRHCKGRLVYSTLNPRGRTVDSHAPRSFRRRQQKVLGYLIPRGDPNTVGQGGTTTGGMTPAMTGGTRLTWRNNDCNARMTSPCMIGVSATAWRADPSTASAIECSGTPNTSSNEVDSQISAQGNYQHH